MNKLRLKVLFGIKDDDFAEAMRASLASVLASTPIAARDFGNFDCAVLHRAGSMQAELVSIQPNAGPAITFYSPKRSSHHVQPTDP